MRMDFLFCFGPDIIFPKPNKKRQVGSQQQEIDDTNQDRTKNRPG